MTVLEKPSVRATLQANSLLNALSPEELERLGSSCRLVRASRGEVIWSNGATADFFGLSADGFVKMVRSCPSGVDVALELMGPGQIFGLMGTLTGAGCPLTAMAVTDLWYLRVPKQAFLDIYEKSVPLKDQLVRKTALRLHGFVDFMARLSNGRVEERIAAILFILAESYGHREPGRLSLRVPLTRQEIGEMAGTTVESTIRTMSRWQKEGLIETEHQFVTILDERRLNAVMAGV
ncbi:MAG: Crp/Fnr family transcriptional regulator [Fimbriimonas sp.]